MTIVESSEAKIRTLSVTISALTVDNRQMTLSIFRQLPKANIWDENYDPIGYAWGIVRYKIKGEGALWVVVDKQGRLFRAKYPCEQYVDDLEEALEAKNWGRHTFLYNHKTIEDIAEELREKQRHNEAVQKYTETVLKNLPQLFISV